MVTIGVLAFQGSVIEHVKALSRLEGVKPLEVKTAEDLNQVSGLILPGGESTTMGKLLRDFGLLDPIIQRARGGMPVWGTCAGMILMARKIVDEDYTHLAIMDIGVRRNAYGSQLDSFVARERIPEVSEEEQDLVFIRAPRVERAFADTKVLAAIGDKIVAVRQNHLLATAFHPELTSSLAFHRYFADMVRKAVL